MINEVIFDLETKSLFDENGIFDPAKLGVSIVSAYVRKLNSDYKEIEGKMVSFWEKDFQIMWPIFKDADRIVGFNSKKFDAAALKPYSPIDLAKLPHLDILEEIRSIHGKRVSLNRVAKSTLNKGKIDVGTNAVVYWNSGTPADLVKLQKYCEADVFLTREIYDWGREKGFLSFTNYWNSPFTIKVDFGYPKDFVPKSQKEQISLF